MQQVLSKTIPSPLSHPLAVGVISDASILKSMVAELASSPATAPCDVLEIRVDLIGLPVEELLPQLHRLPLPLLITLRHPAEGGKGPTSAEERMALLRPLLSIAALVDVEIQFASEMLSLLREAQALGVKVVGSYHDFTTTPDQAVLLAALRQAEGLGLDVAKFACALHGPQHLQQLMQLVAAPAAIPLSVMGMGELGRVSRLVLSRLGSVLNYGYLGEANAPGQWPARKLKELIAEL
jgi:3-dehydroquinate dehydratase I